MVQGYYTLQEAAQVLGISLDELKQMAQKGQIRSFQDRGTLRFRIQDIQELSRLRGGASDPGLVLGDASLPSPSKAKAPSSTTKAKAPISKASSPSGAVKPKSQSKLSSKQDVPEVFEFAFDSEGGDAGADIHGAPGSGSKSRGGPASGKKPATPRTPPSAGSDSDVRLVADGSDVTFNFAGDSAIKHVDSDVKVPSDSMRSKSGAASSGSKKSSQVSLGSGVQLNPRTGLSAKQHASPRPGSGPQPIDSGVRLVPLDDDSDVKILGASDEVGLGDDLNAAGTTDSNVRLERAQLPPADSSEGAMMVTEEVNLDEEIRKHEERGKEKPRKVKPISQPRMPTSSPFELSESEMKMPSELMDDTQPRTPKRQVADGSDSSDFDLVLPKPEDDSSDFDLQAQSESSPVTDDSDFGVTTADSSGEEQVLQDEVTELGPSSGISLSNPVDAGISLENADSQQTQEEMEFDLSLEVEDTPKRVQRSLVEDSSNDFELKIADTPRPVKSQPAQDSGSDFELNLQSESSDEHEAQPTPDSQAEIDLSLDVDGDLQGSEDAPQRADSDSEFELALDDSGSLAALDASEETPQVKSKGADEEQDIFETDFEVPALDDSDSGNVAAADQESSDFDLALDDSELAVEEESGSQVVALDEEEAAVAESDADAVAVDDVVVDEEGEFGDLDADVQVEAEEEPEAEAAVAGTKAVLKPKLVPAAPWGVMPVIFMLPCVIVMFFVGILGYELIQSTANLRAPGPLTVAIAEMLGQKVTAKQ